MSRRLVTDKVGHHELDRRAWLRRAAANAAFFGSFATAARHGDAAQARILTPAEEAARELERAVTRARAATSRPLHTVFTEQYQAVGDAAEPFLKSSTSDCELIARDYLDYYQAKGFEVRRPPRRLTLVVFVDERPYQQFARLFAKSVPPNASGFYSRTENWLVLFDFRNHPQNERGAGSKNVKTLAHEATHQLTFNTGLVNRQGDAPLAILEGLASYSETRRLHGHYKPGRINGPLLDDLAHIRRRLEWIKVSELLTDDAASFGPTLDDTLLAYAQGWLLVYYLMKSPSRLPQFQAYLKAIYARTTKEHRYDDAERNFGDLDRLDQELRREAIRLQQAPRGSD
jgi:hypothetical protein